MGLAFDMDHCCKCEHLCWCAQVQCANVLRCSHGMKANWFMLQLRSQAELVPVLNGMLCA